MGNAKISTLIGALLLLATAGFHLTGLPIAQQGAQEVSSQFFASAIEPLWLIPSVHWSILSLLSVLAAWHPSAFSGYFLIGTAALLTIDAILMFLNIGPFPGELMLVASALLYANAARQIHKQKAQ